MKFRTMGCSESKESSLKQEDNKGVYRLKAKDIAVMRRVWRFVEYDLSHYGSMFSTILFRNHPQYIKYFQDDNIPEFVQDAKIKKKFSAVCTVVSALFIDYSKKRRQRNHLLGYIAMIHKDMQLSPQDLENFMIDLLEMLTQELPEEMTAEATIVHARYFGGLLPKIDHFMNLQREKDAELLKPAEESSNDKRFCGWLSEPPSIYGRTLEHWIMKKHYWQTRTAFWLSMDMELSGMDSFLSTTEINGDKGRTVANKSSTFLRGNGTNSWLRPGGHFRRVPGSSENVDENCVQNEFLAKSDGKQSRTILWKHKCKKIGKNRGRKSARGKSMERMETIKEANSGALITSSPANSAKTLRPVVDNAELQRRPKIRPEFEKIGKEEATNNGPLINDAERARKRRRDKRNVVHPAIGFEKYEAGETSVRMMLQSLDLGTSIADHAGKFAEILSARNQSPKKIDEP